MTISADPRLEGYDRGEPLGSAHTPLSLAACKSRAVRLVAQRHFDEVVEEMRKFGWNYRQHDFYSPDNRTSWERIP